MRIYTTTPDSLEVFVSDFGEYLGKIIYEELADPKTMKTVAKAEAESEQIPENKRVL